MTRTTKTAVLAAALAAAVAIPALATAGEGEGEGGKAGQGPGAGARGAGARLERFRRGERFRTAGAMHARRERVRATVDRVLALSDDQAKTALQAAEAAGKLRAETRAKAAAILLEAHRASTAAVSGTDVPKVDRSAERAKVREALRALRDEHRRGLAAIGKGLSASLTPEQRAKIEEKAKSRGRTVDEERLALFLGRRVSHPWAEALLKARLGR